MAKFTGKPGEVLFGSVWEGYFLNDVTEDLNLAHAGIDNAMVSASDMIINDGNEDKDHTVLVLKVEVVRVAKRVAAVEWEEPE